MDEVNRNRLEEFRQLGQEVPPISNWPDDPWKAVPIRQAKPRKR